jgi:hypothetical protein
MGFIEDFSNSSRLEGDFTQEELPSSHHGTPTPAQRADHTPSRELQREVRQASRKCRDPKNQPL